MIKSIKLFVGVDSLSRVKNIFYGVVNNENSMTELLCNFIAYKPFRDLFLNLFLPHDESNNFKFEDFQTQFTVELNNSRPDLVVTNEEYEILIEVKTSNSGLTDNQPTTYLQHLYELDKRNKYLIFLVPFGYAHESDWASKVIEFMSSNNESTVQTKIIYWNDLIKAIQKSELFLVSEKINEFFNLLKLWFEIKEVKFSSLEVSYMLKPEIPSIMIKLFEIINEVKTYCGKNFKTKLERSEIEYTVFFKDIDNYDLLSFGIWYEFWIEHDSPLCYGMHIDWNEKKVNHFKSKHKNLIEKDGFLMIPLQRDIFTNENCSEEIARLIYDELIDLTNEREE